MAIDKPRNLKMGACMRCDGALARVDDPRSEYRGTEWLCINCGHVEYEDHQQVQPLPKRPRWRRK